MPTLNPGSKVLVTGANGFVAVWLIKELLEKGYSVRGTLRSIERGGPFLKNLFSTHGDRFELVEVADFTKDGAFNEALEGIDAVQHIASPVSYDVEDPKSMIEPAVKGTVGILSSALNHKTIKRIVITSTTGAINDHGPFPLPEKPGVYNEEDWNEAALRDVERLGSKAPGITKYCASKVLAERAAWDLYNTHKDKISWDLTVLNPSFIFGPTIGDASEPSKLSMSTFTWWSSVIDPGPKTKEDAEWCDAWIDVRDFATTATLSLEKEDVGGERVIVSAGPFIWQDWANAANALSPNPFPSRTLPKGFPDAKRAQRWLFDTSKHQRLFGFKLRTIEETTRDTLEDCAKRGW